MLLIPNQYALEEDKAENEIPVAAHQIYDYIKLTYPEDNSTHVDRGSSAGQCVRRRYYKSKGEDFQRLIPRKIINFMLGDLSEAVLKYWVKHGCVGPGKLYKEVYFGNVISSVDINGKIIEFYDQIKTKVVTPSGIPISCSLDGYGLKWDGSYEVIEFKSAANFGYDHFKEVGPDGYLPQVHCYMGSELLKPLGCKSTLFVYMRKETGHIWSKVIDFDPEIYAQTMADFELVHKKLPQRPYTPEAETKKVRNKDDGRKWDAIPTGRYKLPTFPCGGYCPYTFTCWDNISVEWNEGRHKFSVPTYYTTKEG